MRKIFLARWNTEVFQELKNFFNAALAKQNANSKVYFIIKNQPNHVTMKKILPLLLLFVLSISFIKSNVVLAQATIDIKAPNANGLSNNRVTDFDVNTDGTILNNSAAGGTAQLGSTAVSANPNITAGSEAELILFQVTGSTTSELDGKIEIFGREAGVIIANPKGINCDGCGFINANRVDLVTGSGYDANANTFSTISNTSINVSGGGLDAVDVDVLNIRAGYRFINDGATINADSFNVTTGNSFYNRNSATINADSFNVTAGSLFANTASATINAHTLTIEVTDSDKHIENYATVSTDTLNFILTADFTSNSSLLHGFAFLNFTFNNLRVSTEGYFINKANLVVDSFNVTTGTYFINQRATINADSFNVTTGTYFRNRNSATINADSFNVTAGTDFSNLTSATINADSFNVTAVGDFENSASINADTLLNIALTDAAVSFTNTGGVASADTFNLSVVGDLDYTNRGTINSNNFNLNVGGNFTNNDATNDFIWNANDSLIVSGSASVIANSFNNSGTLNANSFDITATDLTNTGTINANTTLTSTASNSFSNTGGVANADTFNLSVGGDFNYVADRGTINSNNFNLNVGGNFTNNDAANDFTWGANDSLVVSGDADITTRNFTQSGVVDVGGTFTINAGALIRNEGTIDTHTLGINTNSIHNPGNITATYLAITAMNDVFSGGSITTSTLNINAGRNFANHGGITANNSFEITSGNTVENHGSIVSDSLDITVADYFRNLSGGDINVATLNITAGGKVTNIATITAGTLNITANNDSSRTDDTGFYVANRGDIQATTLNITAADNFYNRGDISANTSDITAKNIFFLNTEIASFYASGGTYDGGDISLTGDSSFTTTGRIENYGLIDLNGSNLDITAKTFINQKDATIDAATLNLNVNSFIDEGTITATTNNQ